MDVRTAIVTGAGRGIGRAVALRLAADGFRVAAVDVDGAAAERTAAACEGAAAVFDVRDPGGWDLLLKSLPRVDLLVNSAGVWEFTTLADTTAEQFERVMGINVWGTLLGIRSTAPRIAESGGGAIVNLTSIVGHAVRAGSGVYPASKAAIVALTKQAAMEYASGSVRVNAVGPGMTNTEGTAGTFGDTEAAVEALAGLVPLGRLAEACDIADVVAFLGSDQARYITGQTLYADGGFGEAAWRLLGAARTAQAGLENQRTLAETS